MDTLYNTSAVSAWLYYVLLKSNNTVLREVRLNHKAISDPSLIQIVTVALQTYRLKFCKTHFLNSRHPKTDISTKIFNSIFYAHL